MTNHSSTRELDRVDVDRARRIGGLAVGKRQPGLDCAGGRHRFQLVVAPGIGRRRRIGDRPLLEPEQRRPAEVIGPVIVELDFHPDAVVRVGQLLLRAHERRELRTNPLAAGDADALRHPGKIALADRLTGDFQCVRAIPHCLSMHEHIGLVDDIAEYVPAGRRAAVFVEASIAKRPLARLPGKLVDANPVHEQSLWPHRRLIRGRQEVAADRRVDDQPHRRGEFLQEVSQLVVVVRRVVHVVDVEPQLVPYPLAGERVEPVGV